MRKESAEKIKQIKTHVDIVEVISRDIPLEKLGCYFYGDCPLCKGKRFSLRISKQKQSAHCYTCGATFDVFSYFQKTKNVSFFESVNEVKRYINFQNKLAYKQIQRALFRIDELNAYDSSRDAFHEPLDQSIYEKKALLKQFSPILLDLMTDYYVLTLEKKADKQLIDKCSDAFKLYSSSLRNEADGIAETKMRNLFCFLAELCDMIKENGYNLGGMVYFHA